MSIGELIDDRRIGSPVDGRKARSTYEVLVSWSKRNPVHKAIFYSGFRLENGLPHADFARVWAAYYTRERWFDLWYLKVVRDLGVDLGTS